MVVLPGDQGFWLERSLDRLEVSSYLSTIKLT
jgi:hypothetical protein